MSGWSDWASIEVSERHPGPCAACSLEQWFSTTSLESNPRSLLKGRFLPLEILCITAGTGPRNLHFNIPSRYPSGAPETPL